MYGIRNYATRKNIAKIEKFDLALWYSNNTGKIVYGTMQAKGKAFTDKTSDNDWLAVDFIPKISLTNPVDLESIKKNGNHSRHKKATNVQIICKNTRKSRFSKKIK